MYTRPVIFLQYIFTHTPFMKMAILLIGLWLFFLRDFFYRKKILSHLLLSAMGTHFIGALQHFQQQVLQNKVGD